MDVSVIEVIWKPQLEYIGDLLKSAAFCVLPIMLFFTDISIDFSLFFYFLYNIFIRFFIHIRDKCEYSLTICMRIFLLRSFMHTLNDHPE